MLKLAVAQLHYPHAQLLLLAKINETFHQFLFLEVKHVYVLTTNVLKFLVNMCHLMQHALSKKQYGCCACSAR